MGNITGCTKEYKNKYKALHRHADAIVDFSDIACERYKNDPNVCNNMFIRVINTTRHLLCHLLLGKQNEDVMDRIAVNIYAIYLLVGLDMRKKTNFSKKEAFLDVLNQYDTDAGVCHVDKDGWLESNWRRSTKTVPKAELQRDFILLNDYLKYCFWTCVSKEIASRDKSDNWNPPVNKWKKKHLDGKWQSLNDQKKLEEFVLGAFYQQPTDVEKRNQKINAEVAAQEVESCLETNWGTSLIYLEEIDQSIFSAVSHQLFVVALDQLWEKSKSLAKEYPQLKKCTDLFHERLFQLKNPEEPDNKLQTLKGNYDAALQQEFTIRVQTFVNLRTPHQAPKKIPQLAPKEIPQQALKDISKPASKDIPQPAPKTIPQVAPKEILEPASKDHTEPGGIRQAVVEFLNANRVRFQDFFAESVETFVNRQLAIRPQQIPEDITKAVLDFVHANVGKFQREFQIFFAEKLERKEFAKKRKAEERKAVVDFVCANVGRFQRGFEKDFADSVKQLVNLQLAQKTPGIRQAVVEILCANVDTFDKGFQKYFGDRIAEFVKCLLTEHVQQIPENIRKDVEQFVDNNIGRFQQGFQDFFTARIEEFVNQQLAQQPPEIRPAVVDFVHENVGGFQQEFQDFAHTVEEFENLQLPQETAEEIRRAVVDLLHANCGGFQDFFADKVETFVNHELTQHPQQISEETRKAVVEFVHANVGGFQRGYEAVDTVMVPANWKLLDPRNMKVNELRHELECRNLNSKGLKPQLIERLTKTLKAEADDEESGAEIEKKAREAEEDEEKTKKDFADSVKELVNLQLEQKTPGIRQAVVEILCAGDGGFRLRFKKYFVKCLHTQQIPEKIRNDVVRFVHDNIGRLQQGFQVFFTARIVEFANQQLAKPTPEIREAVVDFVHANVGGFQQCQDFGDSVDEFVNLQLPKKTPIKIKRAVVDLLHANCDGFQVENSIIRFRDSIRKLRYEGDYRVQCEQVANADNQWADHIVIVAIANLLKRDIKVYTPQRMGHEFYWISCLGETDHPALTLGRVGGMQYKSLRRREWQVAVNSYQKQLLQNKRRQQQLEEHSCDEWRSGWVAGWTDGDKQGLDSDKQVVDAEAGMQELDDVKHELDANADKLVLDDDKQGLDADTQVVDADKQGLGANADKQVLDDDKQGVDAYKQGLGANADKQVLDDDKQGVDADRQVVDDVKQGVDAVQSDVKPETCYKNAQCGNWLEGCKKMFEILEAKCTIAEGKGNMKQEKCTKHEQCGYLDDGADHGKSYENGYLCGKYAYAQQMEKETEKDSKLNDSFMSHVDES